MKPQPPALWSTQWHDAEILVFGTGDDSAAALPEAAALLTDEERARAERFHFQQDHDRWIRSRALLRLCLGARTGLEPRGLCFTAGEFGKPGLLHAPSAIQFNLSHSGDFAAMAFSALPVGVDIECRRALPVEELASFAFRHEERLAMARHPDPEHHFLELWTAKEAVMKCTGQGLSLPPDSIAVCGTEARTADGRRFDLLSCTPAAGTLCCCAVEQAE